MKRPDNGYVGIGIYNVKRTANFGALIRTARVFGANFVFSVGSRNPHEQSLVGAELTLPLFDFPTMAQFIASIPVNARLVRVELTPAALAIKTCQHPRARCTSSAPKTARCPRRSCATTTR